MSRVNKRTWGIKKINTRFRSRPRTLVGADGLAKNENRRPPQGPFMFRPLNLILCYVYNNSLQTLIGLAKSERWRPMGGIQILSGVLRSV